MKKCHPDGEQLTPENQLNRAYPMPLRAGTSSPDAPKPIRVYYRTGKDDWAQWDIPTYLRKKLVESLPDDPAAHISWHHIG